LLEETSPYIAGYLLWILPTITIIFGAGFLDRYSWLRSSSQLIDALRLAGLVMIVTGGLFAGFQRHLGRIMAYGVIAETGFSLLALSLDPKLGIPILFFTYPRARPRARPSGPSR
jgi:formate hydrogenlyase subunit 3/multisubunit Na+/H+ antiporter MnhD subunit